MITILYEDNFPFFCRFSSKIPKQKHTFHYYIFRNLLIFNKKKFLIFVGLYLYFFYFCNTKKQTKQ